MGPGFEPLRAYKERDWDNIKIPFILGGMVEWSITTVLKTVVLRGTGGSNPSPSAKKESQTWLFLAFMAFPGTLYVFLFILCIFPSWGLCVLSPRFSACSPFYKLDIKNVSETSRPLIHKMLWKNECLNDERKTRLELATPTLARLCSTNWAISAHVISIFANRNHK